MSAPLLSTNRENSCPAYSWMQDVKRVASALVVKRLDFIPVLLPTGRVSRLAIQYLTLSLITLKMGERITAVQHAFEN